MSEVIAAARIKIEGSLEYVYMSRVGITCFNKRGELISFVLDPKESPYTVKVQETQEASMHLMVSHTFVSRYMEWAELDRMPYQLWRWHLDVYPPGREVPNLYCQQIGTSVQKDKIFRTSFEHLAGPELVNPFLLGMSLAADTIPTVLCPRDLVPERLRYQNDSEQVFHPGLAPLNLGILAQYDLLFHEPVEPQLHWVM